ncbi:hypothetical protein GG804_01855 [Sphingomonas histidinilytica]|uniref:hypothetical protein n=1 Tax=Rhizorhabdus histidinilytica TaxID=439228 RepID=UPI001ADBB7BE|nr:hypothetical protein [Rhizorhabdus histidinilytica]MBO9375502.1 hypothetical protein [Rhizorhabdus histidinilytica]
MRLVDELAAHRMLYVRALPTLPDILLIDIPPRFAAPTLPMGRYYPIILESPTELLEMEAFLHAERPTAIPPNLFDRRSSALLTEDIIFARYAPPGPAWPWLLLCCWPAAYRSLVPSESDQFAREIYTIELFATLADLEATEMLLLETLGTQQVLQIKYLADNEGNA